MTAGPNTLILSIKESIDQYPGPSLGLWRPFTKGEKSSEQKSNWSNYYFVNSKFQILFFAIFYVAGRALFLSNSGIRTNWIKICVNYVVISHLIKLLRINNWVKLVKKNSTVIKLKKSARFAGTFSSRASRAARFARKFERA